MKTCIQNILLGLCILLATACGRQKQDAGAAAPELGDTRPLNYHALVIGISDYANTGWPDLGTAKEDALAVGKVLREQYGFNVLELTDGQATRGNILRTLDQMMSLTEDDALLIYFAGHGYYDQKMDEGYWIPYGAKAKRMDMPAKEDWLWNTSINRIVSALPAKHVLLVADTCFGGSLFRGENEPVKTDTWYQRAIQVPSRFVITSGNLEPVLDSGIRHSVFAQELLNYLQYSDHEIFSASDIAISIRSKVSELTGQLVRMGPLTSPSNAGGEFVFVRNNTQLTAQPANEEPPDGMVGTETRGSLERLSERLGTYARRASDSFVRPRVLACMGPDGDDPEEAALVRNRLYESLDAMGGCILVERKAIDELLQEMELGRSELADRRAATEIGKLLPASLILFGEIIPVGNQREIHLRLVDTETSRVLSSSSATYGNPDELDDICQTLARQVMSTMNDARPLEFKARPTENGTLLADWGKFHGAHMGDTFEIISRVAAGTVSQQDIPVGSATVRYLEEESSELQPEWTKPEAEHPATNLWLRAVL